MKTNIIFLLLSVAVTSASDTTQEYNDTSISAEVSINDIGDVELEDLRMAEVIDKIKEAAADGSLGDEDIFENYAANNGFGTEFKHSDIRFTSKGAVDITKKPSLTEFLRDFPRHAELTWHYGIQRMRRKKK